MMCAQRDTVWDIISPSFLSNSLLHRKVPNLIQWERWMDWRERDRGEGDSMQHTPATHPLSTAGGLSTVCMYKKRMHTIILVCSVLTSSVGLLMEWKSLECSHNWGSLMVRMSVTLILISLWTTIDELESQPSDSQFWLCSRIYPSHAHAHSHYRRTVPSQGMTGPQQLTILSAGDWPLWGATLRRTQTHLGFERGSAYTHTHTHIHTHTGK